MTRRFFVRALLVLCLLLSLAGTALAHATLKHAQPDANASFDNPPERIVLDFTEEVEAQFGAIAAYDHTGARVDRGDAALDPTNPTRVAATLKPLDDGLYTVAWKVVSADGHPISGSYGFTVGRGVQGAQYYQPELPDPNGLPPFGVTLGYWLATGALMALLGLAVTQRFVVGLDPDQRFARWAWGALMAGLAGSVLYLVARTAQAAGVSLADALNPALWFRMLTTHAGMAVVYRLALLAVAMLLMPRLGRRWWFGAAVGAAGLVTVSLGGHAAALERPVVSVLLDWIHLVAAGVWTGGLLHFALLVPPAQRGESLRLGEMVRRFSPLAAISVALLAGTGLYPALLHIPSVKALTETAYGMTLQIKLALIVPLLLVASANLLVVAPRLRRGEPVGPWLRKLSAIEAVLMGGVLAAAVVLTNLPPARVALPPKVLNTGMHTNAWMLAFHMKPLAPGYRTLRLGVEAHEGALPPEMKVKLELVMPGQEASRTVYEGKAEGGGWYRFENVLIGIPGKWEFWVEIERPGAKSDRIKLDVEVPEAP